MLFDSQRKFYNIMVDLEAKFTHNWIQYYHINATYN